MKLFFLLIISLLALHLWFSPKAALNQYFQKPIKITGKVISVPVVNKLGERFLLATAIGKLQLSWYQHKKTVHPGETWHLKVKLKPIHGLHNPGGFNLKRWARMRGIVAKGYIIDSDKALLLSQHFSINHFREKIQRAIQHGVHASSLASILNALTIGSKSLVSPEDWLVFQRTGTSHLIAISGLHVGLVVTIAYFILNWSFRCFPRLLLYCPAQRLAGLLSLFIAWLYGFLVSFSLPTQRALIMVTTLVLASLLSRPMVIWKRIALAFCAVIAWQPFAVFSESFWLSFLAVFWLAYATLVKQRLQFVLALGLLPVSLYFFHQYALLSLLSNLVAIPWITMLIVPLCLLAVVLFLFSMQAAALVWWFASKCLWPLWFFLSWVSHFSFSVWQHPVNDFFIVCAALLSIALMISPKGLPLRLLGILLIMPLFIITPSRPKANTAWLTVLDVGQGLSVVIQTAKHVLVYDAGPRFVTGFDAGRSVLVPFLKTIGITQINALMISHGDNDHIGGSFWLVKHFPVQQIFSSIPHSRWSRGFDHCYAGQHWQWDGVDFQVLWPLKNTFYKVNNSSCVLRVSVGQQAILLTGDIEKPVEKALLSSGVLLSSDILVAPHHGSRSSSSPAFVERVHPKKVIFPVGFQNRYHFPAKSVIKRYREIGARLFSTSSLGAVYFYLAG